MFIDPKSARPPMAPYTDPVSHYPAVRRRNKSTNFQILSFLETLRSRRGFLVRHESIKLQEMISRKGNGEYEMSRGSADHASDRASSSIERHRTTSFPMLTPDFEHIGILSNGTRPKSSP